jgi:DNA invertase Pin-like site-specific DNA recombinase
MATYIYSRTSTDKQDTENQVFTLKALYPDASVFEEVASGMKERPILKTLLSMLKAGDTLAVFSLDRIGRNTAEILAILDDLEERKVIFVSRREGVDYSNPCGRLVISILAAVARLERDMIAERTRAALATKRAQGIFGGRRPTYSPEVIARVKELRAKGLTMAAISQETGVSVGRIHQLVGGKRKAGAA